MKRLLIVWAMALPCLLFSQTPQDTARKLIRAGRIFNSESGAFEPDRALVIKDGKIQSVRPWKEITAKERTGSTFIDLSEYTLLPGLIDAHTHLLNKETMIPDNKFYGEDLMRQVAMDGDAYRAIYGAVRAKAYLEAGITAVQDLGNSGQFADIALRRAIKEDLVIGPRMRCAGPGLSTEGGQIPRLIYKHMDIVKDEYRIIKGPDDAVQAVRENITQGADVIKIYSNNTPNRTALSGEEIRAIVREAHRYHVRVTAHATDDQAVYNAVANGVDGIEHGYEVADSTLDLMAKKGVVLVPTDGDSTIYAIFVKFYEPGSKDIGKAVEEARAPLRDRLQRAIHKGVTIVAGSDDYVDLKMPFGEPSKRTLMGYQEAGMPVPEILKAATLNAARHLNWGSQIGILKDGFLADLIAVDNSIDKDMHAILDVRFVMKAGVVYVNKTGGKH